MGAGRDDNWEIVKRKKQDCRYIPWRADMDGHLFVVVAENG